MVWIVGEIFLVIIFGRPEFVEGLNFRDDRVVVNAFGGDLGDNFVRGLALGFAVVEDGGAI